MLLWHLWLSTRHLKTTFRAMSKQGLGLWGLISTYLLKSPVDLQTWPELCLHKLEAYERATQPPPCSLLCLFLVFRHTVSATELGETKQNWEKWAISSSDLSDRVAEHITVPAPPQKQSTDHINCGWVSPGAPGWGTGHEDEHEEGQCSLKGSDSERNSVKAARDLAQGPG